MISVGSLFTGIGGLDLGLEWAGMQVRWQVENNPYCNRVLEKHWPKVKRYGDVRTIDWSKVEPVDLICGGFPCQPVSVAGARKGDADERWLWPEFLRAIREVRPRYALVENVPGLLSAGGSKDRPKDKGRLARRMFGDLAEIQYDAEGGELSAREVGAPHLRKRVFIIAYPFGTRGGPEPIIFTERFHSSLSRYDGEEESLGDTIGSRRNRVARRRARSESANGYSGVEERREEPSMADTKSFNESRSKSERNQGRQPKMPVGNRSSIIPNTDIKGLERQYEEEHRIGEPKEASRWGSYWTVEPKVGRVANGVPSRVDRLKCIGNAVVPQVAELIGRLIVQREMEKDG